MFTLILVIAFLVFLGYCYIHWVRPLLEHAGYVQPLPARLDTFLGRVKVFFRASYTMLVGWLTTLFGAAGLFTTEISQFLQDAQTQSFLQQIITPKTFACTMIGIGVLVIVARIRTAMRPNEIKAPGDV